MTSPMAGVRLAWPDVARGISIMGVVVLHVSLAVPEGQLTWLAQLNSFIHPLRLPLFFVVSGYFSTKVLSMTFSQLFTRRLWFLLVPYLVWGLVELHTNSLLYHVAFGDPVRGVGENLGILALGHSMGWFLHSLILYNCFLWLVRNRPVWQALVASFFPLLLLGFAGDLYAIGKAVMFLPVFVAGALLREYIREFANAIESCARPTWKTFAAYTVAIGGYVAGLAVRDGWDHRPNAVLDLPWITPGAATVGTPEIYLLLRATEQALELPMAIAAAVLIARIPTLCAPLRFVGRHTLALYLGHPIALTLGFGFLHHYLGADIFLGGPFPLGSTRVWVVICLGICAAGGLALWAVGKIPYLSWSLRPPAIEPCTAAPKARATQTQA
ncbi:hypothetical protein CPHO_04140 [Corynebacterium phocae]|uniref:Acyltransferase 3 domain-containing protein n=1 Tax=Corynebacterium phocae TaxID=161895 RepID=A0A1L7D2J8_9CORY|nr:acyltransferase family protein [Corynebacterium phocae]APT92211.1 hypothetical protein CPHO_04140 [Corynebacterium phocae]